MESVNGEELAGAGPSIRQNNFDLVRLLAAFQVLTEHAIQHFRITPLVPLIALKFFPGVPVFFIVSGFLVSLSWERSPSLRLYATNRALRIFPALWVCTAVTLPIAFIAGAEVPTARELGLWLASQLSVLQFYNPDFLRTLPLGALNGSLWTISVELQFYTLLPLLALLARKKLCLWVAAAALAAVILWIAQPHAATPAALRGKVLGVSLAPWLFFFLVGVCGRMIFERRPEIFRGKLLLWAIGYGAWMAIEVMANLGGWGGNFLNPISVVLLGGLTIAFAFTLPSLATRLLGSTDLSYGIYIYHVPIINLLLAFAIAGGEAYFALACISSALALLSWRFIEKPALRFKPYSMRTSWLNRQ